MRFSVSVWRPILLVALVLSLSGLASEALAQEERCTELGENCRCSEPLNTQSWTTSANGSSGGFANPNDSPTATECAQNGLTWYPSSALSAQPETGMPAGNRVNYVWRHGSSTGTAYVQGDSDLKPTTKRLCIRHYTRLSANYFDNGCDGGKYMDINPRGEGYQVQMGSSGGAGFVWWSPWNGNTTQTYGSGNLTMQECAGEWCRFEGCISGDFTGGTGNFYKEARITRIRDGKQQTFPRANMGTGSPGLSFDWLWIANNYRGNDALTCNPSTNRPNPAGYRETSFAMQAEWPFDQAGLFIGPAYEVEGGNGTPPPPPPPAPPAAPALLP